MGVLEGISLSSVYLICLIVGGALLALSLLGGHHGTDGHGLDHPAEGGGGSLASWVSLRSVVSFAAFFGLAGVLAGVFGLTGFGQLLVALVTGLGVGAFTAFAFQVARSRGEVSSRVGRLVGRTGTVIVPLTPGGTGMVALVMAGQTETTMARSDEAVAAGQTIIVVAVQGAVVQVKPWDGL